MATAGGKSKSRVKRKPLRDVSNGGLKLPFANSVYKKFNPHTQQPDPVTSYDGGKCSDPVDKLLLVHSDLSVLIHQIDELVAEAIEKKVRDEKEIETFAHVLNEMQNSLKPWVSRFQKILPARVVGSKSQLETSFASMKVTPSIKDETSKKLVTPCIDKFDLLVSPSPLVSWRAADCAAEVGRSLFMLTPLPKRTPFSSRVNKTSKSVFEKIACDVTDDFNTAIDKKTTVENVFASPEKVIKKNDPLIVSTPYMNMSPPKSCVLLEPSSEWCNKTNGIKNRPVDLIRPVCKTGNSRKVVEASPIWCMSMSPPKTCVLLEPSDEDDDNQIKDIGTKLTKTGGIPSVVSCNEVIDSTPMCKDLDTTVLKGKRAGENTLKKELWTRFEAATVAHGFHLKSCFKQENGNDSGTTNKGFMDLLEEVSCDDTNSVV